MSLLVAALISTNVIAALGQALDSDADWTMTRTIRGANRPLESAGTVSCRRGEGITWTVLSPFDSSVTMTTNAMVFADEDGVRTKGLAELPHYARIRQAADAFAAGDAAALKGVFKVESEDFPDGGWRLRLTPEIKAMRRLAQEVVITGSAQPTNVVMTCGDGGRSVITFRKRERGREE